MKKIIYIVMVSILMLSIVGCEKKDDETVTITYYGRTNEKNLETDLIAKFEEENPGIKVNYVELPEDTDQKLQTISTILQAKDSSLDVFVGDVVWTPIFAGAGWVLELDEYLTEEEVEANIPGSMKAYTYNDHYYGLPFFVDGGMLFYREDLLNKYNKPVPKTWEELMETAKYIMDQENDPNLYGFAGSWKQYEGVTCNLTELVWSHGGDFLNKEGKSIFNSDESIEAMQVMDDMVHKYEITPPGVGGFGTGDVRALALNGQLIFSRDWPSFYGQSMDEEKSNVVGKFKYTVLPAKEGEDSYSTLGGWGIMVSKFSEHPEEAIKFMKFRASYESQKYEAQTLLHNPTLKSLYEDEDIKAELGWMVDMYPALMKTNPRPQSPYYAEISAILQQASQDVIADIKTPEQAVKDAHEKIQSILK